jgi:hypothetical protein
MDGRARDLLCLSLPALLAVASCVGAGGAASSGSAPNDAGSAADSQASSGDGAGADGAGHHEDSGAPRDAAGEAGEDGDPTRTDSGAPDGTSMQPADASPRDGGAPSGMITCTGELGTGTAVAPGTPLLGPIAPNPLLSRSAAALATLQSPQCASVPCGPNDAPTQILTGPAPGVSWRAAVGPAGAVTDGYLKIDLGKGPSKVMVTWLMSDYPDYAQTLSSGNWGILTKYTIEVSTDGVTWQNPVTFTNEVNGAAYRTREHVFDFTGMSWVRFTMNEALGAQYATVNDMGFFDVSNGTEDTWAFAGGDPGRATYGQAAPPTFADVVHGCHPAYAPAMLNISGDSVDNVDTWLTLNPDVHFWALDLFLSSANYCNTPAASGFATTAQTVIDKIRGAGRVPILPRIQYVAAVPSAPCPSPAPSCPLGTQNLCPQVEYGGVPAFNAVIDALVQHDGLLPAPDMYAWFQAHPAELCQTTSDCEAAWLGIQPGAAGILDVQRMWAAAAEVGKLYAP